MPEQKTQVLAFYIEVNYDLPLEETLVAGNYDRANQHITSANFPSARRGTEIVEVHLVPFGLPITTEEVKEEFDKQGLSLGGIEELLALSVAHPDLQQQFYIIAPGLFWTGPDGHAYVPVLWAFGHERYASLLRRDDGWLASDRFLAVKR